MGMVWPTLPDGPRWIEAQVHVESGGEPRATSPVGAKGLLQLMPATAAEMGVRDREDPTQNLHGGVSYLKRQYDALTEVPDPYHRLLWAFASYNGGRGYVDFNGAPSNTALELAKERGQAAGVREWWRWEFGKSDISRVVFRGKRPDAKQMTDYVSRIERHHAQLLSGGKA